MKANVGDMKNVRGKHQAIVQKRIDEAVNLKLEIRKVNAENKAMKLKKR